MSHDVEIVTHCWKYSRSLAYQLSGLVLSQPKCEVQVTLFCNSEDERTALTVRNLYPQLPVNVHLVVRMLDKPFLFRRAIGRNLACKETKATGCLILTDADYVWPGYAVDQVLEHSLNADTAFTFPHHYWKMLDHETGDRYLALQDNPQVLTMKPEDFSFERIGKAIGGIQVYRADAAREHGYLDGTKWLNPHRGEKFACCRCDRAWRGWIAERGHEPQDFDGGEPFRIRHSRKGREFGDIDN